MLIKVIQSFNDKAEGPDKNGFYPKKEIGTTYETDEARGKFLIAYGYAVEAEEEKPKKKKDVKAE